jgi:hypothetical protein
VSRHELFGTAVRQVVLASALAWAVAAVAGAVWSVLADDPFRERFGVAAFVVGGLWLIGGGGVASRFVAVDAIEARRTAGPAPREQEPEPARRPMGLTPLALNIVVAAQLLPVGLVLAG